MVGDSKSEGQELEPSRLPCPEGHDLPNLVISLMFPYSVYDLANDKGWLKRQSLSRHRAVLGRLDPRLVGQLDSQRFPRTQTLLSPPTAQARTIPRGVVKRRATAPRRRTSLAIEICHIPPGTSN